MKHILIFIDRDGTLEYDKKYHLGHQKNWKSKVKLLPNVVRGLKLLKKRSNFKVFLITNQTGVAIKQFPLLTEKRAHEVCQYVLNRIEKNGVKLDGYELCGKASPAYVKKRRQFTFHKKLVGNFSCIKPRTGMIKSILRREKIKRKDARIYVLGDRTSDVETALNINGFGILIPFKQEPGHVEKVKKIKTRKKYIAKDFLDASRFILKREK